MRVRQQSSLSISPTSSRSDVYSPGMNRLRIRIWNKEWGKMIFEKVSFRFLDYFPQVAVFKGIAIHSFIH
jgi:hypothetical protein